MNLTPFALSREGYEHAVAWLNTHGRSVEMNPAIELETDGYTVINLVNHLRSKTALVRKIEALEERVASLEAALEPANEVEIPDEPVKHNLGESVEYLSDLVGAQVREERYQQVLKLLSTYLSTQFIAGAPGYIRPDNSTLNQFSTIDARSYLMDPSSMDYVNTGIYNTSVKGHEQLVIRIDQFVLLFQVSSAAVDIFFTDLHGARPLHQPFHENPDPDFYTLLRSVKDILSKVHLVANPMTN